MKLTRRTRIMISSLMFVMVLIITVVLIVMSLQPSLINGKTLNGVSQRSLSTIDTSHLAAGLLPPTNKWFSGIALQKNPKTIFPTPLAVSLTESSFSVGLPTIAASADVVTGGMAEKVTMNVTGATSYKVTRYDELSVDVTYSDSSDVAIGTLTMTAGSPYVQFSAINRISVRLSSSLGNGQAENDSVTFASNKGKYIVSGFRGASVSNDMIDVTANSLLSIYVSPSNSSDAVLAGHAGNRIIGSTVSYQDQGDTYRTELRIKTDNGKPTLYALLPHQTNDTPSYFAYDTLYGKQRLYDGISFTFTTPAVPIKKQVDISRISSDDKALLTKTLQADNQSTTEYKAEDSYYAGKELYRTAQLLEIAEQIGESSSADNLKSKLKSQLGLWFDDNSDRSFYYDTNMKSIVGDKPSFGSENGNDHHFHYGYFIYAASILAQYDKDFLDKNKDMVNLLVADIANYKPNEQLPLHRNFDPYFGHSWASGDAAFDDGNNQESSSEAINAWTATSLWADQTGNETLRDQSDWMLSNEASSTSNYWMNIDTTKKPFSSVYTHSLVSLNWSGKREYGTFFSSEPMAKLGIQLIPMSPTQMAISTDNKNLDKHINEAIKSGYSQPFGDYILMYNSQLSSDQRMTIAKQLPDSAIDGANSRTYLYASLLAQR